MKRSRPSSLISTHGTANGFRAGLARVFIDNYAAIPSQSIRRLLALHEAGVISILPLGPDYAIAIEDNLTEISVGQSRYALRSLSMPEGRSR
ncbi:Uncharacterised protein [Raoultella terrigena]|uniref:Uncharacterized protein n=1 Tax=Raoultella terrigena TaxID=577 RepID=A0A3P8JU63_RAOTE|nr:Uncharacterised protein [Raoultella terrigena]